MKSVWELWYDFDVWGNPDDGFTVNDKTRMGDIELDDGSMDSARTLLDAILVAAGKWFDAGKVKALNPVLDWEGGGTICIDLDHEDGASEPFIELYLKKKDI